MSPEAFRIYKQNLPLLDQISQWMSRRLGHMLPLDDVRAHAHDGLLEAVQTFDPERSSASTYFSRKMRWAILDAVRRERRMYRLHSRASAIMASERLSRHDDNGPDEPGSTEEQHVTALDRTLDKHAAALAIGLVSSRSITRESEETPEERTVRAQQIHAVRKTLHTLPERERQLIERHYFEGEEFDTIATELGISKSWASRLHAQAIETLSQVFRDQITGEL